jgi:undecaprenyl diphosphate synthase
MDGNGRWAVRHGYEHRYYGHIEGAKVFKRIVRHCKDIGVPVISFYVFSADNWRRPTDEVAAIMDLLRDYLDDVRDYIEEQVRVVFVGDKSSFDEDIRVKMLSLENDSENFDKMTIFLLVGYDYRTDNADYVPDVDLLIRTGGDSRISGYMPNRLAYSELMFLDTFWPDFDEAELDTCIKKFKNIERRFGDVKPTN